MDQEDRYSPSYGSDQRRSRMMVLHHGSVHSTMIAMPAGEYLERHLIVKTEEVSKQEPLPRILAHILSNRNACALLIVAYAVGIRVSRPSRWCHRRGKYP